jgi:hypothetical protein
MNETPEDAARFVSAAIDKGVNYFDVAPSYGDAQERLGPALEPYRSRVFLACKTQERSAEGAKRELLDSLRVLRTEYFDVYQMHSIATLADYEQAFEPGGAMETFVWAKREGLIRNIGFSTHNEDVALKCLDAFSFDTVLFPMFFAMGVNDGWGDRISARANADGYGLLAMKTLIHRAWFDGESRGPYPKSWCKPFFADQEELAVASMKRGLAKGAATLIPPGNFEHFTFMLDHIDACVDEPLTPRELKLLEEEALRVKDYPIFHPEKT